MDQSFNIKPGIYVVPNMGRVNATKKLSIEQQVNLYLNTKFPFITLLEAGVKALKKRKLKDKQIAVLINHAKTKQEVDLILQLKPKSDTLKRIADNRNFS